MKFWVAHPKELQERTDMWDLVRRLNSPEDPVGMYGTIVPGCVRLTALVGSRRKAKCYA